MKIWKKIKTKLLPILGITALTTISAPIIASCGCGTQTTHCWYSPIAKREVVADHDTNTGTFVLVVDSKDYKQTDFDIKITGDYKDILTLDSFKVNQDTIEVVIRCLDAARTGKIPFGLTVTHKEWKEEIQFLTLVASVAITTVTINGPTEITYNTTETYTAKVFDTSGKELPDEEVEWHVDETGGGKIDRTSITGNSITLKGVQAGQVVLTATSKTVPTLQSNSITITILYAQPTDLVLNPTSVTIRMDQTETVTATVLPEETTHQKVDWEVTTGGNVIDIETTDNTCLIKPKDTGDAVITAKTLSEGAQGLEVKTKTCAVKITEPLATQVIITPATWTLWNKETKTSKYNTLQYSAETKPTQAKNDVTWAIQSGNAYIDQTGLLTLDDKTTTKSVTVKATAQDEGKAVGTANLTIKYLLEDFTLGGDSQIRGNVDGATFEFPVVSMTPTYADWDTNSTKWNVDTKDPTNIYIDETTGKLTAKAADTITIHATRTTHDGAVTVEATKTVEVLPPYVKTITVDTSPTAGITEIWNTDSITAPISYKQQLYAATVDPTTAVQDVTWSTNKDDISIDETLGLVSLDSNSHSEDVTITATSKDGRYTKGTKALHIKYALEKFTVTGDNTVRVKDGATHTYSFDKSKGCTTTPEQATYDASSIKWYSSDTTIATIGETSGELNPIKAGTVTIHAEMTTHDGTLTAKSEDFTVEVQAPWSESVTVDTNPTGITEIWNTDDSSGGTYNTIDFDATVKPEGASQTVKWTATSAKSDIAIDENTGVATLTADTASPSVTATATAQDGGAKSGSKTVNIKYVLKNFKIKGDTQIRSNGTSTTYAIDTSSITPSSAKYDATGSNIVWHSSDTTIADFENSQIGVLTGKKAGTVNVTATVWTHIDDHAGEEGSWTVTSLSYPVEVLPPYADSVNISGSTDRTIWNDGTSTFRATVSSTTGQTPSQAVEWSVYSDSGCSTPATQASISTSSTDYSGTLTIPDPSAITSTNNEVWVKAKATDVPTGTTVESSAAKVTIKIPLSKFYLKSDEVESRVGQSTHPTISVDTSTYEPTGCSVDSDAPVFRVDDTSIATIDESSGELSAVKAGTVKVYATLKTHDGTTSVDSEPFTVTVKQPYTTSLTITGESLLWTDETDTTKLTMNASYQPSEAIPSLKWTSSNTAAATIDETSGKLTLVGNGTTTITATAQDGSGKEATHSLTVKVPATKVEVTSGLKALKVADTTIGSDTYGCTVTPSEALVNGSIVWSVDDSTKATIDSSSGFMTANTAGTVNVYATWRATGRTDVKSVAYPVTITAPAVSSIALNGPTTLAYDTTSETEYTVTASPTGASNDVDWYVYDDASYSTPSTNVTLTQTATGKAKLTMSAGAAGNKYLKVVSKEDATKEDKLPINITTSWDSIFIISDDGTTVEGFKPDVFASGSTLLSNYVGASKELMLPNVTEVYKNVTKIGADAFKDILKAGATLAGQVLTITIPSNITEIGANAFENCDNITGLQVYGSTTIGDSSFIGCSGLTTINALNVTSVGTSAFEGDDALSTINFGTNASLTIGERAFADIQKTVGTYATLTANPASIGKEAFMDSAVVWPGINNVAAITSIGEDAFNGCQLLESGETLTVNTTLANATIGTTAFYGCGIESIVLPEQTSDTMYANWGDQLFAGCMNLHTIDLSAWTTSVPSNLADFTDMFLGAGGTSASIWYYKSGIDQTVIDALSTWLSSQVGAQTFAKYWTATPK